MGIFSFFFKQLQITEIYQLMFCESESMKIVTTLVPLVLYNYHNRISISLLVIDGSFILMCQSNGHFSYIIKMAFYNLITDSIFLISSNVQSKIKISPLFKNIFFIVVCSKEDPGDIHTLMAVPLKSLLMQNNLPLFCPCH